MRLAAIAGAALLLLLLLAAAPLAAQESATPTPEATPTPAATLTPTPEPSGDPLCGSIVSGDLTLSRDVLGCPAFGIKLESGARLDCDGHSITGSGGSSGIWILLATGAEVRNCRVSGFVRGIRIVGGSANRALGNELFANSSYGIEVTGGTFGNWIEGNLVRDSGDEGIHLGANTTDNDVVGNQILRSFRENLYFIKNRGNRARGNTLAGSGAAAIFVKHSQDSDIRDNVVLSGRVQIRGDSVGNLFTGNVLKGDGFLFEAFEDPILGWTYPHGNQVEGGSMARMGVCFTFNGAYDNHARHVIVDRCTPVVATTLGGQDPVDNTADLCGDGLVSGDEACDLAASNGSDRACCTAQCALRPPNAVCRPAANECDVAETCAGATGPCPANGFAADGLACTDDGNACTVDRCDGQGRCAHPAGNAGAVCRAAAGTCDLAEVCSGTSKNCPTDRVRPSGTVCRAVAGECDIAETCDGSAGACPDDAVRPAGETCRAAAGACDVAEACDGIRAACPVNSLRPAGSVCRAAVGLCDVAETCSGASSACPPDALVAAGKVCRPAAGGCDVAETCTGASASCPADVLVAAGTVCRAASGTCDVAEACNGTAPACPSDAFKPAGTSCRGSVDQCDVAESCTGSTPDCPRDVFVPNGRACDDGNACTRIDRCRAGRCVGTKSVVCRALDACHDVGVCDPSTGQCDDPVKRDGSACNGGVGCTTGDECIGGRCVHHAPVACDLCEVCDRARGCVGRPREDCARPSAGGSKMLILDRRNDTRDRLSWTWEASTSLDARGLGDPTASARVAFCLYDGVPGAESLAFRADVSAAGVCGGAPCWASTADGYVFRDPTAAGDGVARLALRSTPSASQIGLVGRGSALEPPRLPLAAPLTTQLQSSAGGCWSARFSSPARNAGPKLKGVSD